jgi:hypothetical protein
MAKTSESGSYTCGLCDEQFTSMQSKTMHMHQSHLTDGPDDFARLEKLKKKVLDDIFELQRSYILFEMDMKKKYSILDDIETLLIDADIRRMARDVPETVENADILNRMSVIRKQLREDQNELFILQNDYMMNSLHGFDDCMYATNRSSS